MAQNRKPPAFMEYAAAILANRDFRLMSLAERGLLYTIRLECWENIEVPVSYEHLAKYIGYDSTEVNSALTKRVKAFLHEKDGTFVCPELDNYRQHLADIRLKQSAGGKGGAAITNAKKNRIKNDNFYTPNHSINPQVPRQGTDESLVKLSTVKLNQEQSLKGEFIDDPFVMDMIAHEKALYGQ
jgi:hypothetical protein